MRPLVRSKVLGFATTIVVGVSVGAPAFAEEGFTLPTATVDYSIGLLNVKAQEYVYAGSKTLSRLDWRSNNAVMFNTSSVFRFNDWLRAGIKTSTNIDGSGKMDDYDFDLNEIDPLANCPSAPAPLNDMCHSNSSNALKRALFVDAYAAGRFYRTESLSFDALVGYRWDHYRWQAVGGTANYASLPPGNGISYEQTWGAPYIGLGVSATHGDFTLNGRVIGSIFADGSDRDTHHLRSLLFTDDFSRSGMIGADVGVAYRITPRISVTADYHYQNWLLAKGSTTVYDLYDGGKSYYGGNAAGGNNVSHMFALGVKIDLDPAKGTADKGPSRSPTWSGWYAGVETGTDFQLGNWRTTGLLMPIDTVDFPESAGRSFDDTGNRVGLFGGYAWRNDGMIWGVEADIGHSNANRLLAGIPGTVSSAELAGSNDQVSLSSGWDGSLRGRIGTLVRPDLQLYATGGAAIGQVTATVSCPAPPLGNWCVGDRYEKSTKTLVGWTAGAGFEWAIADGWFSRGEYRYTDLGKVTHTFFADSADDAITAKYGTASHRLTLGLGYRY